MAHITLSQLRTVLQRIVSWATSKFAAKNTVSGRLDYADLPVVVLATMGSELDGTSSQVILSPGSTYFSPAGNGIEARIMLYVSPLTGHVRISDPDSGVIYCNARTNHLYRWDAREAKMVPVGGQGGTVSVTTNQDGTFTIHVGETDYTINLNHTHENMAKLVVCEESDLPPALDNSTIYAITDSGETEIEKLIIRGMEFAGGGYAPGTPAITRPSGTTINLGENDGSGVSKAIGIKANSYITGDLTVGLASNSDLSFDTSNLPSGVTYNSGAGTLTIAQATAILGVNITIVYSGSGAAEIDGGLVIAGGGAAAKSVTVVVELPKPVELTAIKTTGTQYFDLGYSPNSNTKFELDCKFEKNDITDTSSADYNAPMFISSDPYISGKRFVFQTGYANEKYTLMPYIGNTLQRMNYVTEDAFCQRGVMIFDGESLSFLNKTQSTGVFNFEYTGRLYLGYSTFNQRPFDTFNLIIYGFKIYEGTNLLHDFKPVTYQGTPGLWDDVNDTFISSASGTDPITVE